MSRRALVKGIVAAGVAGTTDAGAAAPAQAPPPPDDAVTPDDIAVADKLAARSYTEPERALMVKRMGEKRETLKTLREVDRSGGLGEPATLFDPRLPGIVFPTGKSGFRLSAGRAPQFDGSPESLAFHTLADLSRLVKARKITSTVLTRMYLDRLKRLGPRLNCVVTLTEERALAQAAHADREITAGKYRGPLHGIPWGAKDLFATRGIRTTFGARPYENQVFDYDATVVRRLDEAGAVLVAKLSMGELAMGDVWFGGLTRNPWQPERGSSGSSAGPGSAVAAGLVGFAIGTETLGSIVSPCVVNGVTGLRPTYGRVSRHGAMALSWTMDKIGPMCRGVEDCALVLSAIFGPDGQDASVADVPFRWNPTAKREGLRVGVDARSLALAKRDKKRHKIYRDALEVLANLGLDLRAVRLPRQTSAYSALAGLIIAVESGAAFAALTASGKLDSLEQQEEFSWPNTFRVGSTIPAVDYLQALRVRRRLQEAMAHALKEVDLYVTIPWNGPSLSYTNLTGHPEIVTRCGMLDGLPLSISFVGNLYREDVIIRIAHAFERATPWHREWPDTEKIPPSAE